MVDSSTKVPAPVPASVISQVQVADMTDLRCSNCNRLLFQFKSDKMQKEVVVKCPRCKAIQSRFLD